MLAKDDLTGVIDRQDIIPALDKAAQEHQHLILVFMDLDNLMRFNAEFGYQAGDEWIRGVVGMFNETFGGDHLVGRYGGDEFLAGVVSHRINDVFELVEDLRARIEKDGPKVTINGKPTQTGYTVAFGVAAIPPNATDTTDLIEKAKLAVYRAKEAGGNRVCYYEEKDSLTGLLNYYGGQRALEDALAQAKEKRQPLSVFMMDIDRFKAINDEFGHWVGDEVIKQVGRILTGYFKNHGILSRTGGDEFTVILPNQHADTAFMQAEDVRKLAEDSEMKVSFADQNQVLKFQITGGIAAYPSDASERIELKRKADEALYRAKQTGRNRICLPANSQMVTKTSYYTQIQLERLASTAKRLEKSEAYLLREALDDLLRKYGDDGAD